VKATSVDAASDAILERYLTGAMSAPVALMQLLIETEDFQSTRTAVMSMARDVERQDASTEVRGRVNELLELLTTNAEGCERIAQMLRADVDSPKPAQSIEEGIAFSERLFDWSVQQSEEASVALYSLGNPQLLEQATAEIVAQFDSWGVITRESDVLDIGCGIGRLLVALAPRVRSVTGVDVSAEMVKVARKRCAAFPNASVIKGDGRGLSELDDESFAVVIAVDSFPYLRQSGYPLVERYVAESTRVLRPQGQLVILNYSYLEDDAADAREVRALASDNGLEILDAGVRPFALWDGVAFRLRKGDAR
jgi:SAM-dependent methyltransferase